MTLSFSPPATSFIDETAIAATLARARQPEAERIRSHLAKARELAGLDACEMADLMAVEAPELLEELFAAARGVKEEIYGSRVVLFAPLYVSNHCHNECLYCAFRAGNESLPRRTLTYGQIATEVKTLVEQGHKRVLMVAGESFSQAGFDYVLKAIDTIYHTKSGRGEIRRVNVNLAPLTVEQFARLKEAGIGTYQLFQETYHRATYARVHTGGKKRDYLWRLLAMDRVMEAGIDDVGIGALLGLYDWKFELLAMRQHIAHLEEAFGVGPHTISVPRLEPAAGSGLAAQPLAPVADRDFKKLVAILRLAVPYTGIIMSTRENAALRRETLALGVSQISAGSRTNPGGYAEPGNSTEEGQFQLGDHRSLDEVVRDCAAQGYVPSFCTACYRLGRTGADFMHLAKPGLIKEHCAPNAVSSLAEYLADYATPATRAAGDKLNDAAVQAMERRAAETSRRLLARLRAGERDVYV